MPLPDIKKRTLLFVLTLAAEVFCANFADAQITKKADRKLAHKEYSEALRLYAGCLEDKSINHATTIDVYYKMAQCYMAMNYYRPAYNYIKKAVAANPSFTEHYPIYCEAAHCVGNYMDEAAAYDKMLAMNDTAPCQNGFVKILFASENNRENPNVPLSNQYAMNTFGKDRGLAFWGDKLFYSTSGFLIAPQSEDYASQTSEYKVFCSPHSEGTLTNPSPETGIPVLRENNVTAIAVHPSSELYFVVMHKGAPRLYVSTLDKDSVYSGKKAVKIGGEKLPVESLVFTEDGNRMIFSAQLEGGFGGKDLWYSDLKDGIWQRPVNMGEMTNTAKDEITPSLYGNYLFFASNGLPENFGGFDIYGIDMDTTKHGLPENLKMPYNSCADDFSLVISPDGTSGFLVSTRDTSLLDDKIYGFSQIPDFTLYRCHLTDNAERPQAGAEITVIEKESDKIVSTTSSDDGGNFSFFLNNKKSYIVEIRKDNFFPNTVEISHVSDCGNGIANNTEIRNFSIDGFVPNSAYRLEGVFNQTADTEILESCGLKSLLSFLKSNPQLDVYLHLFGYLSGNDEFNELLSNQRLANLKDFLMSRGIAKKRVKALSYSNEIPTNYPPARAGKDSTFALYFVLTPHEKATILPKTTEKKK